MPQQARRLSDLIQFKLAERRGCRRMGLMSRPVAIDVSHLGKTYDKVRAVEDLSFQVYTGEISVCSVRTARARAPRCEF